MQDVLQRQIPPPQDVLHKKLFAWWQVAGRVLPWREKVAEASQQVKARTELTLRDQAFQDYFAQELRRDPYRVVVAEVMLQQTQVDRVLPKYSAWMEKWPKISDLAAAELAEVLIFWQGLGYNRRARFLWLLSREITNNLAAVWPETETELLKLPGIGKYTARAILSFAFGHHVAVVDTNVKRVIRRLLEGKETADLPTRSELEWFAWADDFMPTTQADPWNQLIMDFGALICTAKAPQCEACPARHVCYAQKTAEAAGFSTYREYLKTLTAATKLTKTSKPTKRFEDTDRFFRGRIIDQLRLGPQQPESLWQVLHEQFGLLDRIRFDQLLKNLQTEGLIRLKDTQIFLG